MEDAATRKIRLKNTVERGQAVDGYLARFGQEWYEKELQNVLNGIRTAPAEELTELQAYLRAVDQLYRDMHKAVDEGKRAAERLHKEVTDNA